MNPSRNYYRPSDSGGNYHYNAGPGAHQPSMDPSRTTTSSRDEASVSVSNASDIDSEWIEEDEPGVYITIRQLVDGTRELRRVRFRLFFFSVSELLFGSLERRADQMDSLSVCHLTYLTRLDLFKLFDPF